MKKTLLLIGTKNKGKFKEIKIILKDLPYKIVWIEKIKIIPNDIQIREYGKTFSENAKLKAQQIGKVSGVITLADDSGLEVDALDKKPGVYSKRFGKTKIERNLKLLKLMENIPEKERTARFVAAVAIYNPKNRKTNIFKATSEGKITSKLIGTKGFGYDPIFFSNELNKTFAQATIKEKNEVSHRGRVLRKAKEFLVNLYKTSK